MKKCYVYIFFLISFSTVVAQSIEPKYLLRAKSHSFSINRFELIDPYLSPLTYSGWGAAYLHSKSSLFTPRDSSFLWQSNFRIQTGVLYNPVKSASMAIFGGNCNWGVYYYLKPIGVLKLLVGGVGDVELGMRSIARNINNPVNLDFATNLNIGVKALYGCDIFRRHLGFQFNAYSPIMGYMFVPEGGASYYEMFMLGNLSRVAHFSSLHNKRAIKTLVTVDVPFNKFAFRVGVGYEALKYEANDLLFRKNEFSFTLGLRYDVAVFSGRKIKVPSNFYSSGL